MEHRTIPYSTAVTAARVTEPGEETRLSRGEMVGCPLLVRYCTYYPSQRWLQLCVKGDRYPWREQPEQLAAGLARCTGTICRAPVLIRVRDPALTKSAR
jgi:hypothetical protein